MDNSELDEYSEELEPEDTGESEESEALPAPLYEIFSYPSDTTLKGYLEQWDKGQLFIPSFQREYVWDQTRASKLIESFLLGLPVPPAFLYKPAGSKSFWIIDGHQRIRSIVDFQKGIFGEHKFRLKGVDARWNGKAFSDLSDEDKFSLETTVLRAIVIQQSHPADHSSIYHIFERLNTGGLRLNAMEVRQCVYASPFLERIKELNKDNNWRHIIGLPVPDKRLKDVELILRLFSLYLSAEKYEKPMKHFLNNCCIELRESDAQTLDRIEDMAKRFLESCKQIVESVGAKPFHLRGRLNYSALDAIMTAVMRSGEVSNLSEKYKNLVGNPDFQSNVSYNTSDESAVKTRLELSMSALK